MSYRLRILAPALPLLLLAPGVAAAQAPSRGEAMAALNQPAAAYYTRQQIDQMVAPIALYPDQLLTQVLMAATYPQQIVDAAQWLQDPAQAALKGDALVAALQPLPWDPSVKALVAFPQVVQMLSEHIEWTQALGVAFATQQPEVMARVQALRHLALRAGRIRKVRHLRVREEGEVIVIASEEPDRVFVPVYNPVVVYGAWPDPGYQPVYLPPPPDFVVERSEPGFEVSAGFPVIASLWGWSRPDWRDRRITIDRTEYARITRSAEPPHGDIWQHPGPVMLAAPATAPHPPAAAAAVPAGTVAPVAAAAVVQLPKRAAAQPGQIHMPNAAAPATQAATPPTPGAAPTTPGGRAPGAAPSGPTQAGTPSATMPPHPAESGKGPAAAGPAATHHEQGPTPPSPEHATAPTPHPAAPAAAAQAPHPGPQPPHPAAAAAPHPEPQPPRPAAAAVPHPGPQPPHPAAAAAPHPEPQQPRPAAAAVPHPGPQPPHPAAAAVPHPEPQPPHAAAAAPHPGPQPHPAAAAAAPHPAPPHATAGQGASTPAHPQPAHRPAAAGKEEHNPEH